FDRVVLINLQIPIGSDIKIDQTVTGKQREHVIKKTDTGIDFGNTGSVQIETEFNLGLRRLTADGSCTSHGSIGLSVGIDLFIIPTIITPERVRANFGPDGSH